MHPILFQIGDFYIGTYGLMIVAGLAVGLWLALRRARIQGLAPEFFYDLAFVVLLSGFLGARLFFILLNLTKLDPANPMRDLMRYVFAREGFVFMGGFVTAVGVGVWYTRRKGMPLWETADILAPALAAGHAFGRIGCYLAGCCYGKVCPPGSFWAPLAVSFPRVDDAEGKPLLSFAYLDHWHQGLLEPGATGSLPVIPTQLIEAAANVVICLALLQLWRQRSFAGQIFIFYLFFYGAMRFGVEFLRGDEARGVWGGVISTSQIMSLAAGAAGVAAWIALRRAAPAVGGPRRGRRQRVASQG
jgi:phosphatidylglycerol:prolipoprotein diacylglycerol transferase